MPYFGDIFIPWLTNKDTSINKNTIEKNFVDDPPQVFELNADLEAGTYSAILNEDVHDKNESFSEQRDSMRSMPYRHGTEFPYSVGGDEGYVIVDTSTVSVTPSQSIQEAELDLRFLDSDTFQSAIIVNAENYKLDFQPTPEESVVPIPSSVSNVTDSPGSSLTPEYTVTSEDGDLDLYLYSSKETISYDQPADFDSAERVAPVRLFRSLGGDRVYSNSVALTTGCVLENGLIRSEYNETQSDISVYDASWRGIGNVNLSAGDGHSPLNENYSVQVSFVNSHSSRMYRGYPVIGYIASGLTDFTFTSSETLSTADDSAQYYRSATNSSGDEVIVIRTDNEGSFSDTNSEISVSGIDSNTRYTFFVGTVPSGVSTSDYARYVYNIGSWRRSLIQR